MVTTPELLVNSTTDSIEASELPINEDNAFGFIILGVFLGIIAILVVGCVVMYTDILSCIVGILKKKKKRQPLRQPRNAYFVEDPFGSPTISRSHLKLHESRPQS